MTDFRKIKCGITPERISKLGVNEVFVFGSNLLGHHAGGAAHTAYEKFGAIWGIGVGIQGQSYAIPTMHGPMEAIRPYVDQYMLYVAEHPGTHFLVTSIGCGIAGFTPKEMAPLFAKAINYSNVSLPEGFIRVILGNGQI